MNASPATPTCRTTTFAEVAARLRAERARMIEAAQARTPEEVEADRLAAEQAARQVRDNFQRITDSFRRLSDVMKRRQLMARERQMAKRQGRNAPRARSSRATRRVARATASGSRGDPDPGDPDPSGQGRAGRDDQGRTCEWCNGSMAGKAARARFCQDACRYNAANARTAKKRRKPSRKSKPLGVVVSDLDTKIDELARKRAEAWRRQDTADAKQLTDRLNQHFAAKRAARAVAA